MKYIEFFYSDGYFMHVSVHHRVYIQAQDMVFLWKKWLEALFSNVKHHNGEMIKTSSEKLILLTL